MNDPTPPEFETEENFFAEALELERIRAGDNWKERAAQHPEDEEEEEEEEETEPESGNEDPFATKPKKKAQRNWLSHRIEDAPKIADVMKKRKRGRPPGAKNKVHNRDKAVKEAIQVMTAAGVKKNIIARLLRMSPTRLSQKFSDEMEYGSEILTTRMVNALIQKGLDGNVSAIIFYLKSKAGWREIDRNDIPGAEGAAISDIERNQRLMSLFMSNPQFKEIIVQRRLAGPPIETSQPLDGEKKDVFDV